MVVETGGRQRVSQWPSSSPGFLNLKGTAGYAVFFLIHAFPAFLQAALHTVRRKAALEVLPFATFTIKHLWYRHFGLRLRRDLLPTIKAKHCSTVRNKKPSPK